MDNNMGRKHMMIRLFPQRKRRRRETGPSSSQLTALAGRGIRGLLMHILERGLELWVELLLLRVVYGLVQTRAGVRPHVSWSADGSPRRDGLFRGPQHTGKGHGMNESGSNGKSDAAVHNREREGEVQGVDVRAGISVCDGEEQEIDHIENDEGYDHRKESTRDLGPYYQ